MNNSKTGVNDKIIYIFSVISFSNQHNCSRGMGIYGICKRKL